MKLQLALILIILLSYSYATTEIISHGQSVGSGSDTDSHDSGMIIRIGAYDLNLTQICMASGVGASRLLIASSCSPISPFACTELTGNSTISNLCASVSYVMKNNTNYFILASNGGSIDYAHKINSTLAMPYPINGTNSTLLTWIRAWQGQYNSSEFIRDIANITVVYSVVLPPNPNIELTLLAPANNSVKNTSNVSFYANATSATNCNLSLNGTSYAMSAYLNGTSRFCNYNATGLADGVYSWSVYAYNSTNLSNNVTSDVYSFIVDTVPPQNVLIQNSNNSFFYLSTVLNLTFYEPSISGCKLQINNTNFTGTVVNSTLCQYTMTNQIGNFTVVGFVNDSANNTVSSPIYMFHGFNYSTSTSTKNNPELDLESDDITLFFTFNNYYGSFAGTLQYNGANYTPTVNSANLSTTISPPQVSTSTVVSYNYFFNLTNASISGNRSNTTTVQPTGLILCGGISNSTAIMTSTNDASNGTAINATMNLVFYQTRGAISKNTTISITNYTSSICLYPSSYVVNASSSEIYSNPSYSPLTINRVAQSYNNTSIARTILMSSSTTAKLTIISGTDNVGNPLVGKYVLIEQQNTSSFGFFNITTQTLNDIGQTSAYLVPNSILYRFSILDSNGALIRQFSEQAIQCDPFTAYCIISLQLPISSQIPNSADLINPSGSSSTANNITTWTFTNAICTFSNVTGTLQCNTTTAQPVQLTAWGISANTTTSTCIQTGSGAGSLSCSFNISTQQCIHYLLNTTISTNQYNTQQTVAYGQVCTNQPGRVNYGAAGVLAAFIMTIGLGMAGLYFGIMGMTMGLAGGLVISRAIGFIMIPEAGIWIFALALVIVGMSFRNRD